MTAAKNSSPKIPEIPEIPQKLFDVSDAESFFMELFTKEPFDACRISGISAGGRELKYFSAWGCMIESCRFNDSDIFRGEFVDTVFKNSDFSGCDMTESSFRRCRFINCKGVGVNLSRSVFSDVTFENSVLNYANFSISKFSCVRFLDSSLKNSELSGCNLKNIGFSDTNLSLVNFARTHLSGIDFTSCNIEGIIVSSTFYELKGAIVTDYQASCLAGLLGIIIG